MTKISAVDPFQISGPALLSFSGGLTSAYMLWRTLEAHGGSLPDDVHVTFANTGKEREETLRFVHDCATHWGVKVHWLEWEPGEEGRPSSYREVGFNSASRNGEPFAALIEKKGYLPNTVTRFCTMELKIRVMRDFMLALGYTRWVNIVGLRADEQGRVIKARARNASAKERWTTVMPLNAAGISQRDVLAFWSGQPFTLGLRGFEGNCDACFPKGRGKLWEIERNRPGTLAWWIDQEEKRAATFSSRFAYSDIQRRSREQPDLYDGAFNADPEMDAECGLWCGD